ncbi:hypothetical protein [Caballeronia arvi]|uniref:hypothetical protein n=1 Tax=Caballeronia arvi TaxID=1777135 RepID=UPI00117F8A67|nr:hypothetical protein [Caballeronia arvi]
MHAVSCGTSRTQHESSVETPSESTIGKRTRSDEQCFARDRIACGGRGIHEDRVRQHALAMRAQHRVVDALKQIKVVAVTINARMTSSVVRPQKPEKLDALAQASLHHLGARQHLCSPSVQLLDD